MRAMSSKVTSMGEMYVVLERADQARTWPHTRPVDLSKTHAPESPGARGGMLAFWLFQGSSLLNTVLVHGGLILGSDGRGYEVYRPA